MSQFSNLKYTDPFHIHGSTVISMVQLTCDRIFWPCPSSVSPHLRGHLSSRSQHSNLRTPHNTTCISYTHTQQRGKEGHTSFPSDDVLEVHYVQHILQVLLCDPFPLHVRPRVGIDHLIQQAPQGHVRPGMGEVHGHVDGHVGVHMGVRVHAHVHDMTLHILCTSCTCTNYMCLHVVYMCMYRLHVHTCAYMYAHVYRSSSTCTHGTTNLCGM